MKPSKFVFITLLLVFYTKSMIAKPRSIVIMNNSPKKSLYISYISDILLENNHVHIKANSSYTINLTEDSLTPVTVFMPTIKYIGLSVALMPGDTVSAVYNAEADSYVITGKHPKELALYKSFSESKFSARTLTSPVLYSIKRPFNEFIHEWRALWAESEQRLIREITQSGIRTEIKEHFVLEARLRLMQILLQPTLIHAENETILPVPSFYQDTVLTYMQKIRLSISKKLPSPSVIFTNRGISSVMALREGKKPDLPTQYSIAKKIYTGYDRKWTCYSVIKGMFQFGYNLDQISTLLADFNSWNSPNSPFSKKLAELNNEDKITLTSDSSLNANFSTTGNDSIKLFDILKKHKNKVIYIDLWASWCAPCISEIPASLSLREAYQGHNLAIVYLSLDKDQHKWLKATADLLPNTSDGYRFRNANQAGIVKRLKIDAIPRYLLIDKQGMLLYSNAPSPSDPQLLKLIDSLLQK